MKISPSPNGERADRRLSEIVHTAADLFDRSGYANATMEEIAHAVRLAKPTLYHYVRSKDEILHLIHQKFMDAAFQKLEARIAAGGSPPETVRGLMQDVIELVAAHRPLVRVFFEHFRELPPAKRRAIYEQRRRFASAVERIIREGHRQGRFHRDVDPRMTTFAIFGICNWTYQWYDPEGRWSARTIADAYADLVLHGIETGRARRRTPRSGRRRAGIRPRARGRVRSTAR